MDAACAIGMDSFIVTSLSMFPELTVEAFTAGNAGNFLKARDTQQRLTNVLTSIGKYGTRLIEHFSLSWNITKLSNN